VPPAVYTTENDLQAFARRCEELREMQNFCNPPGGNAEECRTAPATLGSRVDGARRRAGRINGARRRRRLTPWRRLAPTLPLFRPGPVKAIPVSGDRRRRGGQYSGTRLPHRTGRDRPHPRGPYRVTRPASPGATCSQVL
jgi:hypothetical protein